MLYASVAQFREYSNQLAEAQQSPATNAQITNVLTRASAIVFGELVDLVGDRSFQFAEYGAPSARVVSGLPLHRLTLPAYQLGSITQIEQRTGTTWTLLDVDSYDIEPTGKVRAFDVFGDYWAPMWDSTASYKVTASWGYGPVPTAIEEITLRVAVNIWRSKSTGGFSETVGAEGQGVMRAVAGITKDQHAVLEKWAEQWR